MTALESPRRVLLGRWRHRAMLGRIVVAWLPAAGAVVLAVARPLVALGLVCCIVAVRMHRTGDWRGMPFRSAWWRTRWWFDARAAGLVVVADPHINAVHEAGRPTGVELAPRLISVRCRGPRRVYTVKALPGQRLEDFDKAQPDLAFRWRAQVTVEAHPTRRRVVVLGVTSGDLLAGPIRYRRQH